MSQFLAPIINEQQLDANGDPLVGGTIEVYLAGTSTPATTTSDKAGLINNAWPMALNTLGVNAQGAVWIAGGALYKFVIKNAAGVVQRTLDSIAGMNDNTVTTDQWVVYQAVPTYVSATSFTVAGDQTQIFQIGRRLKTTNTGGSIYSTITNSVYGSPNTTVTVVNDSGSLDSGLSQVSYGIVSPLNTSAPLTARQQRFTANGNWTVPAGVTTAFFSGCGGGGGGASGGGGGGGNLGGGGGGGGAGLAIIRQPFSVVPGAVYAVVIGANGTGGSASSGVGNNGTPGTSTTVVALSLALGGGSGGIGGGNTATNAPGGPGGAGFPNGFYGNDSSAGSGASGGAGASSPFGGGGSYGRGANGGTVSGFAAGGFGGGGGGGGGTYTAGVGTGGNGGAGTPGFLAIEW